MERYPAKRLVHISARLETCTFLTISDKEFEKDKNNNIAKLKSNLSLLLEEFKFLKLNMSAIFIEKRIIPHLFVTSSKDLFTNILTLQERFHDEIEGIAFFMISSSRISFYEAIDLVSPDFQTKFPKTYSEIKEAGKAFATTNYTSSVFHLMRALENLLKILANSLDTKLDISNWGNILNRMKEHIQSKKKDPSFDIAFYQDMHAQLYVIKNAWRNPTMHVERNYEETEAKDIFNGVKGLSNIIAKKLTEEFMSIQSQSSLQPESSLC